MRPRRHHVATLYASCFQEQTLYHPQKKKLIHSNNLLGLVRRLDIICSFSSSSSEVKKADTSKVLSVAIVGGGPSGFYTAKYLKSEVEKLNNKHEEYQRRLHIDIIEKMPIPFGLVRYGVAPDHPETKNVEKDFSSLICKDSDMGSTTTINYVGNVTVGNDTVGVSLQELLNLYDAVVLCYGCHSDKKLLIEGADMRGILSAREFVAWYNGHPDFVHIGEEVKQLIAHPSPEAAHVVIIGQGNVALDCARILSKGTMGLLDTDIASHALPVLQGGVKQVTVIGRRGHIQGAFTIKELRELTKLMEHGHNTSFTVFKDELDMGVTPASIEEMQKSKPKLRIDKLLHDCAVPMPKVFGEYNAGYKNIILRFLLNPIKFIASPTDSSSVGAVLCERTRLQGNAGNIRAVGTGRFEKLKANMVLVSIGYKGVPLSGLDGDSFNYQKGIIKHVHGKVITSTGILVPEHGLYASGWIKRGPSGIIANNIADAKETVSTIIFDLENGNLFHKEEKEGLEGLLALLKMRNVVVIDWQGYEKIDKAEKSKKRPEGQPRKKIVSVEEMISIASTD